MKRRVPSRNWSRLVLLSFGLLAGGQEAMAQAQLSNGSPTLTLDFSASMPASVATSPASAFAGTGFEPGPSTAGRLNSQAWAATGWSNGSLAFGGTQITANTDYTRGSAAAAVSTGGFYAYTAAPQSVANPCLMIQPGGSDWAPGTLTLRIENTGTTAITELDVSYNLFVRNDQGRANSFNFSHSADDITYTPEATLNYTSPEVLDGNGWVQVGVSPSRNITLTGLNVAPGGYYYLRWSGADVSGSGSRDEFGLDDIILAATFAAPPGGNCMITCPDPVTIECDESPDTTITGQAVASADCDPVAGVSYSDSEDFSGCGEYTGTIIRTWTAQDVLGNTTTCQQIITVEDTTPPTWDQDPLPQDMTVECDAIPDPDDLTATDNCATGGGGLNVLFINELHYDNTGADVDEFVEVAGTAGQDLTGYSIVWYNGSNGASYGTTNLAGILPDEGMGTGALAFYFAGIQNGAPDGLALVDPSNTVLQFLSYEGAFLATDGPANGIMSTDIGVLEVGNEPIGLSLQLIGTGSDYPDFFWTGPDTQSPGALNDGQEFGADPQGPGVTVMFNQTETPSACEDAYTLTRTWTATDPCGNATTHTQVITVEDTTPPVWDQPMPGNVTVECDQVPAPPSPVTASDNCDDDVEVVFAESRTDGSCPHRYTLTRTWTATDNCDNAITHTQVITVDDTTDPVWDQNPLPQDLTISCSQIPPAETLTATDNCTVGMPGDVVFINEIHYDNVGTDQGEFIEIAGSAGLDLTGYSLVLYNGANPASAVVYGTLNLSGIIPDEGNGTGTLVFAYPVNGIQNGPNDGVALVQGVAVLELLSYEGSFTAADGPAAGMVAVDMGVAQEPAPAIGLTLQRVGSGMAPGDFVWTGPVDDSPGTLNAGQNFSLPIPTFIEYGFTEDFTPGACLGEGVITRTWTAEDACGNQIVHTQEITLEDNEAPMFSVMLANITVECDAIPVPPVVEAVDGCGPIAGIQPWINEIHYDNVGTDQNEFFEIAGPAGIDLADYTVYLYNGANGLVYDIRPLSGMLPNQAKGYGALAFVLPVNGLQNGSPDGLALVQSPNTVVQFLSYEGAFVAADGPAAGQLSLDIGVAQEPPPALGLSLQLTGAGNQYSQFVWSGPAAWSPGALNTGQLAGPVEVTVQYTESITPGNCIGRETRTRTWTATDDCGNQAVMTQIVTVQDNTPPIAQCRNTTLYLDGNGEATLNPADIDNGSSDNCSPVILTPAKTTFGCQDKGANNIILTVTDDCGNSATCLAIVTVLDTLRPVIACPFDRIINLDPGLCCAVVSWADPTITDNCPFVGPVMSYFQNPLLNSGWYGFANNLENLSADPMLVTGVTVRASATPIGNYNFKVYMRLGTYQPNLGNAAGWTLMDDNAYTVTGAFVTGGGSDVNITFATPFTIPAGQTAAIYYVIDNGSTLNRRIMYNGGTLQSNDGNIRIYDGAGANAGLFGGIAFQPRAAYLRVNYQLGGEGEVTQIGGPLSGEELCKDDTPWTVTYEGFDASGNRSECSFTIEMYEYANPVTNLVCNDNVQISLGEDCLTEVGADDVLEGGPYGCYDDYEVTIFNAQNVPLPSSPFVGSAQIGGPWKVLVSDPVTGNKCWGQIIVEEKMPPNLVCADLELACGADIPLAPAPFFFQQATPLEQNVPYTNYWTGYAFQIDNISANTVQITGLEIQAALAGDPAGMKNVRIFMRNGTFAGNLNSAAGWTEVGNLDINVTAGFPTVELFEIPFHTNYPVTAGNTAGVAVYINNGNGFGTRVVATLGTAPTTDGVITINQNPGRWLVPAGQNGFWTGEAFPGENPRPQLKVFYAGQSDPVPVTDNCTPEPYMNTIGQGLDYSEELEYYTCAENAGVAQSIFRYWTATDLAGNTSQCLQRIDIRRPSLSTVELPLNYDDLDEPALTCPTDYPGTDITGSPSGGGCGSLQSGYTDKVLEVCQGSYTIIRTWTLHDMCTGEIGTHDQVIKVMDKTPPVLFCPEEHAIKVGKTQSNGYQGCTANVMMPWIQVTDECSTLDQMTFYVWTTLPDGSIVIVQEMNADGFFVFDLPVQPAPHQYLFRYTAIDACGNKEECAVMVPVRDQTPPNVICETFHIVALTDSITLVHAGSFDDGSFDDCSMLTITARRGTMNSAGVFVGHPCNQPGDFLYGPSVRFYCCDGLHPTPLFVDVRFRDAYGNDNFCMVPVTVVDKVRPVIWCPDDITVQCGMPYEPTGIDTFVTCIQPEVVIKNAYAQAYPLTLDIFGIPDDARIADLDLGLRIDHEVVNQLQITLYSPLNRKATVLPVNGCAGQPVPFPWNIDVTFNDQAYDINVFNATGQYVPANFACTSAKPGIGAYNQGHMKPRGDELKIFNGQPLNSFTNKNLCFTVSATDIDVVTNRMSNFQVQNFILNAGLIPGDRILLEYASATGAQLQGIETGQVYLFQVISNNTIEFLTVTGSDITGVAAGSTHMFCASGTWLLVVEDTAPLGGGVIREVCLRIGWTGALGHRPQVADNTEECGLTVTHQDLGTPDKCADNTFINRRWTVTDAFSNNTNCIQRVYFEDETPLTVQFPCDVTVNCPLTPDATGEPVHNGDCELPGIEHQDHVLVTTDACYKILRTWIVKDWCLYRPDGVIDYATTNINDAMEEVTFTTAINALFTERKINTGDRFTLRYHTSGSVEIPGLIEGDVYSVVRTGGTTVRFEFNTTKQQSVNITGTGTGPHVFRYANSDLGLPLTCDVLLEWYPFTDWYTACCNPLSERRAWEDDGDGYFTFTQEIKVVDNEAPQWEDCSDKEICSFNPDCEPTFVELICPATDGCTPQEQLAYQWSIDLYADGTEDVQGVTSDASGAYPNGTHRVVFKVTDQCGNWNTCTKLVTIRDCKKPTPICIDGLVVELMPSTGFADVYAESFESGDSYDNCTEYENLTIKVERKSDLDPGQTEPDDDTGDMVTVSCLDMPPNTQTPILHVIVWVGDEAGNWDYCETTLWIQDWMGPCAATMNTELQAYTVNEEQEGIAGVTVSLSGSVNHPGMLTSDQGQASFGQVPTLGQYTVTPHKDILPLNGVSTYDLLLIQKHLLGIKMLGSPYKLIAADVNNSCSVSISDIIELRKMILTPGMAFANNTSWRFVESGYAFPNPVKPCNFPEIRQYAQLTPGQTSAGFVGMKIGDVSGDAVANNLLGVEVREMAGTLAFGLEDPLLEAGREYTMVVTAEAFEGIQGYQYTLEWDPEVLEFVAVEGLWPELGIANFGLTRAADGMLATSWHGSGPVSLDDGTALYAITVRPLKNGRLSDALRVTSRMVQAEAYDREDGLMEVALRFDGAPVPLESYALYQNEPNPFRDLTVIGFQLPAPTTATLRVYDVTGQVVKEIRADYGRGYHEVTLSRAEVRQEGMLYYELETSTHRALKRMILVD